eukprot:4873790-Pyramimonas_sp.AAC.1
MTGNSARPYLSRRRMPYRVEWDDSDESDEESDLIIDPDYENYHITIDEEQGEGPVPDEPLSSAIRRDRITNRGDLHIETEEVKPDYDVNPTGEWVIGDTKVHGGQPAYYGSILT